VTQVDTRKSEHITSGTQLSLANTTRYEGSQHGLISRRRGQISQTSDWQNTVVACRTISQTESASFKPKHFYTTDKISLNSQRAINHVTGFNIREMRQRHANHNINNQRVSLLPGHGFQTVSLCRINTLVPGEFKQLLKMYCKTLTFCKRPNFCEFRQ